MPSKPTEQPTLKMSKHGLCTLAGLNYQDLRGLLTAASLRCYADEFKAEDPAGSSMADIVARNNAEAELWHRDRRLLLGYIEKLMAHAIRPKYDYHPGTFAEFRKRENRYWRPDWCQNPDWPQVKPQTWTELVIGNGVVTAIRRPGREPAAAS